MERDCCGALGQFQMTGALLGVRWRSSCNLCVLGISIFAVGSQSGLWSGARVGECHVVLQEMVNMCGSHRILWLFVHAADEAISSYGLFALSSEARSFIAVDF